MVFPPACLATPSVGTPVALPSVFPPEQTVELTVTSEIITSHGDPALIPEGVYLFRVDANGTVIVLLGTMHDDGAQGDAVAGDGISTLTITRNETNPGTLYLRVSAPFRTKVRRLFSGVGRIPVDDDLPETWTIDDDNNQFSESQKDCNDANAAIHPQAPEVCNGADDHCNGRSDESS